MNNKKQLIDNARQALAVYQSLNDDKYHDDNGWRQDWHAVNVKRRNDQIDIDDILENPAKYKKFFYIPGQDKLIKKYQEAISAEITDLLNDSSEYNLYYNWLDQERDHLIYELSDIENITDRAAFKYIKDQSKDGKKHFVYFLGRSGGWACFQDNADGLAEELAGWLDDNEDQEDLSAYLEDIKADTDSILQAVEEVNFVLNYIDNFNKNLNFHYEIFFRISEIIDQEEAKEEAQKKEATARATDKKRLIADISAALTVLMARLNEFKADKPLTDSIKRNLKSIRSIIDKQ